MSSTLTNAAMPHAEHAGAVLFPLFGSVSAARMRTIRIVRRLIYLVVLLVIVRYCWVMIHLEPVAPRQGMETLQAVHVATEALAELGMQLPQVAPLVDRNLSTAGPLLYDRISNSGQHLRNALQGVWQPERNPVHAQVLGYVALPMTQATLDAVRIRIDELLTQLDGRLTQQQLLFPINYNAERLRALDKLLQTFLVDARVAVDEFHDSDRALRNLVTALHLARLIDRKGAYWGEVYVLNRERQVLRELMLTLQTPLRNPASAEAVTHALEAQLNPVQAVLDVYGLSMGVEYLLDPIYTSDAAGGYLVPSYAAVYFVDSVPPGRSVSPQRLFSKPTSAWWNLAAPAFDSRARSRARLERIVSVIEQVAPASTSEMVSVANQLGVEQLFDYRATTRAGGVYRWLEGRLNLITIRGAHNVVVQRRAVFVMARLAAYHAVHRDYPAELEQLTAFDGLPVPLDLNTNQPFVYRRHDTGSYGLASVDELQWEAFDGSMAAHTYIFPRPGYVLP